mmetsp:Transcript_15688/g.30315  ORF Transcript_15688/g.30315 Transcript_15688/m.30315 type:complete len:477 (+) Transcript_15688:464-1894(+)|eukprot:CAMPEP_0171578248 /NCGR_PEP_ID=MMETSP0961-20121227/7731_1 /TAXON_ID=87120 /ORGANISM="Aurantiochytrium limacinum, Strain ATCCMYA-1381" /LENGTH=476 /DNA_ID=CAMNT_0012134501 /DNA_START=992 /DNA_END=2422 /DNA_ORIENTATION=-
MQKSGETTASEEVVPTFRRGEGEHRGGAGRNASAAASGMRTTTGMNQKRTFNENGEKGIDYISGSMAALTMEQQEQYKLEEIRQQQEYQQCDKAIVKLTAFLAEGSSGRVALAKWADAAAQTDEESLGEPKSTQSASLEEEEQKTFAGSSASITSFSGDGDTGSSSDKEEDAGPHSVLFRKRMRELLSAYPSELHVLRPRSVNKDHAFALKIIDLKDHGLLSTPPQIQVEMDIMRKLSLCTEKNPFVVDFLFAETIGPRAYIGMGVCSGGDLFTLLSYETLKPAEVLFYAVEMALGLQHLHDNYIIHGDLKPENIALNCHGHVRLIDFGLSVHLDPTRDLNRLNGRCEVMTQSGTLPYCAPEIMNRRKHGVETDWWSYAVILFEMLFECLPWYSEDDQETCSLICAAPLEPPSGVSIEPRCFDLIERLLVKKREARLGFATGLEEIKAHRFFKRVDWTKALQQKYRAPFILESSFA